MNKIIALSIIGAFISGCATSPEQQARNNKLRILAADEPVCESTESCRVMWDKAVYYVSDNAQMAIRNSSDNLVETYSSNNLRLHAKVNKVPMGGDKYKIKSVWGCGNVFGCNRNPYEVKAEFNAYVRIQ